jgi:hypothetical protein
MILAVAEMFCPEAVAEIEEALDFLARYTNTRDPGSCLQVGKV